MYKSYKPFFTVGARNIKIRYQNWRGSILTLRTNPDNTSGGKQKKQSFLKPKLRRKRFSANKNKSFHRVAAGTLWHYKATRSEITVTAVGAITTPIDAFIRMKKNNRRQRLRQTQQQQNNNGGSRSNSQDIASRTKRHLSFEYWFNPRDQPKLDITNYFWHKVYDQCSVTCGIGKQVPRLMCINKATEREVPTFKITRYIYSIMLF